MLYNKTEKIICQVFFLKISTILILICFIKNDIIINVMFHGEHIYLNNKDEVFFMGLYLLLFFISYIWVTTLIFFKVLGKRFQRFVFVNFICSIILLINIKVCNFLEIIFMLHMIILLTIVSYKANKI